MKPHSKQINISEPPFIVMQAVDLFREPCEHVVCGLVSVPKSPRCANPVAVQCRLRILGVELA